MASLSLSVHTAPRCRLCLQVGVREDAVAGDRACPLEGSPPPRPVSCCAPFCVQVGVLVDAVREQATVPEGFQLIIDSMAGLH